jgi:hypothetical protein
MNNYKPCYFEGSAATRTNRRELIADKSSMSDKRTVHIRKGRA